LVFPGQPLAKALTLDVRHREPEAPGALAGIVDGQDVRVLETGRESDLTEEAFRANGGGQVRVEHLERHRAIVSKVVRQEDSAHTTVTQLTLEAIAVSKGGLQTLLEVGHGQDPVLLW